MSNLYEVYPNYSNNNLNNLWKPIDNNWNNTYSLKNISKDSLSSSPYALYTPLQNLQQNYLQQSNIQSNLQQNYLQQQSNIQSNLQPKNLQQQSNIQSNLPNENFVNYENFLDFTSRDLNSKFIRPNITRENSRPNINTNNLIENYENDCEKFLNHYKNCNYCQYIHYKKCKYKHSFLFDFLIYILIGIFLIKLLKY